MKKYNRGREHPTVPLPYDAYVAEVRQRPSKEQCKRGHSLTGPNCYVTPDGRRQCRECRNTAVRKYDAAQRAAQA